MEEKKGGGVVVVDVLYISEGLEQTDRQTHRQVGRQVMRPPSPGLISIKPDIRTCNDH